MTDQLSDISSRIEGVRQLGTVVNAMKGIAAARVRAALTQVEAVDSYCEVIADAMSSVLKSGATNDNSEDRDALKEKNGLLVFCAEQGFAGAFTERVLDSIEDNLETTVMLLVGSRGLSIIQARGIEPIWNTAMPSYSASIPKLADRIAKAVLEFMDTRQLTELDVIYTAVEAGRLCVVRKSLFPLDLATFSSGKTAMPLIQLPRDQLLNSLGAEYLHARICKSALHAFASENQARMVTMSSAHSQIATELDLYHAKLRQVRQEAITAEIIELGTGSELMKKFKSKKKN